jgi:hypothetical protein
MILALVSGLFGGLVGLGGGLVLVPLLTLFLGVPITTAIPASQVAVVATAMGGTGRYLREGQVDLGLVMRAALVTMVGAMVGARLGVLVPVRVLEISFAMLIFVVAAKLFRRRRETEPAGSPQVAKAGFLFMAAGLVAGMLGVGGGILNVPAIRLALRRPMITAVAASSMMIAFTGAAGAAVYARAGHLDWRLAMACTTGAFVGGLWGAHLGSRLSSATLQTIFTVIILYVGVEMTVRALGLPWWR